MIPNILEIAVDYFNEFPDSWVLRLSKKNFKFGDKVSLESSWKSIAQIEKLKICNSDIKDFIS